MTIRNKIMTWQMVQPTSHNRKTGETTPGKLEKTEIPDEVKAIRKQKGYAENRIFH